MMFCTKTDSSLNPFNISKLDMESTTTIVLQLFWILSRTTWVTWYQKGKIRKVKPIWIYWSKRVSGR